MADTRDASGETRAGNMAAAGAREQGGHSHHQGEAKDHQFDPELFLAREAERLERVGAADRVREMLALVREDATIVDIGAGVGSFALLLARALPHGRVVAVDRQPNMATRVKDRARDEGLGNLRVVQASADALPLEDRDADLALFSMVLHDMPDPAVTLAETRRVLRPGGHIYVVEFVPGALEVGPPPEILIAPERLETILRDAGFVAIHRQPGPEGFYRASAESPGMRSGRSR